MYKIKTHLFREEFSNRQILFMFALMTILKSLETIKNFKILPTLLTIQRWFILLPQYNVINQRYFFKQHDFFNSTYKKFETEYEKKFKHYTVYSLIGQLIVEKMRFSKYS